MDPDREGVSACPSGRESGTNGDFLRCAAPALAAAAHIYRKESPFRTVTLVVAEPVYAGLSGAPQGLPHPACKVAV